LTSSLFNFFFISSIIIGFIENWYYLFIYLFFL
jgi:hypothetical protein